jgi:ADP-dependent NAD(P)H-hydrate dehydratase / NAD(P)H-hydrate epimerase
VQFADAPPEQWGLAVDALLGMGIRQKPQVASRALDGAMADWLAQMLGGGKPVLHADVLSGLLVDTGQWLLNAPDLIAGCADPSALPNLFSSQRYTLSLLTLKLGLFTAQGRDACGEVWFDDLGISQQAREPQEPSAWLLGASEMRMPARLHASHKGSYGDVAVIGGASGMQGAALLVARAALHTEAGKVFVALLGGGMVVDPMQPELMFRDASAFDFAGPDREPTAS